MAKLYQEIIEGINKTVKSFKEQKISENYNERDKHYFIEGLHVAKQIIEDYQDIGENEIAYETFEEMVKIFKNLLDEDEFKEIVQPVLEEYEGEER